ncbi:MULTISPECIES: Bug family tripartite tricarboxylate transporter substrate binding protein [unclassified Cupriavidus]|uniref:Bug family tripartite tricarboxylate transporter substrate binding protein n=1 Tax=unclassified Cupriavidus TaxID=2640874 RepID=UPI000410BE9E|nr:MULTISPECIES: Bug family tripartite tricarboxylate transporter substrate binding protein [unclassified Cupriavidus]MBP0637739.1 Bug family tripartite tricarboxylate transporter substrate binding protein [Cupriavidus sp. AcVe19-6a]
MAIFKTLRTVCCALALGFTLAAHAQDKQPIRLLVGFPPGGSTDTVARVLADKLQGVLGQVVIVDNKPGAGGRIATGMLKHSAPDGLTYMVAPNATAIFPTLLYPPATLKYDLLTDLSPVAVVISYPLALVVSSQTGVSNVKEYVAWLKAHPKEAVFGSAGLGGQTHFTGLQFGKAAGVPLNVVPYKGNGPLATDLIGGQLAAAVMTAGDILPHARGGKVRIIGVFSARRSPLLPDVPTVAEQGVKVDSGEAWTGVWAPAKTPRAELERMQAALGKVLAMPDVRSMLEEKAVLQPDYRDAADLDRLQRKELAYWGPVIKASGFKPEQ